VTSTEQQSSWKALLGGLRKNSDITSMLIPAEFIRPESSLERLQDTMQHGRLLEDVVASPSSAVPPPPPYCCHYPCPYCTLTHSLPIRWTG